MHSGNGYSKMETRRLRQQTLIDDGRCPRCPPHRGENGPARTYNGKSKVTK